MNEYAITIAAVLAAVGLLAGAWIVDNFTGDGKNKVDRDDRDKPA